MRYFDGEMWTNQFHSPGQLPDVGSWLNNTFSGLASHWQGAVAIALATTLVSNLVVLYALRSVIGDLGWVNDELTGWSANTAVGVGAIALFSLAWQGFGWIAINRYMQRAHHQAGPSVAEACIHALKRLPKYVAIVVGLLIAGLLAIALVAVVSLVLPFLGLLVVVALLIGSVWLFVKLTFLSAALAAGPSDVSPIRASASVSTGRFWGVFGRIVLFTLVVGIAGTIIGTSVTAVAGVGPTLDTEPFFDSISTTDDGFEVDNIAFGQFFDSGNLLGAIVVSSLVQAATTLVTSSAFMRLYLDSGAPSELG